MKIIYFDDDHDNDGKRIEKSQVITESKFEHQNRCISEIDVRIVETSEFLKEIDLSRNKIEKLNKNLFDSCPNLETLNVSSNKLNELNEKLFSGCNKSLKKIDFFPRQSIKSVVNFKFDESICELMFRRIRDFNLKVLET